MNKLICCCLCAIGMLLVAKAGSAQSPPGKHVEFIVSVARGGGTDATARLVQKMFDRLRLIATSEVVNKPGGGGADAWAYLASFERSGGHLAISTPQLLADSIMRADPRTFSDFTPITNLYNEYVLIAVRMDSRLRTGRDLAARLRDDSVPVSVAVAPGLASHNHIAAALVARAAGGDPRRLQVKEITKRWWEATYLNSNETRTFLEAQSALLRSALIDVGLAR